MSISDEFSFINKIKPKHINHSSLITGIGDDSAVISGKKNVEQIICMDTMVEDVHFTRKTMTPFQVGYKVLAANISDVAAMGGIPTFYLVSIAIPKKWEEEELLSIFNGMENLATQFGMDLIGGDTVSTKHQLVITVTVLGEVEKDKHLLRSNAKEDDIVFVTGTLGDSAAGLQLLLANGLEFPYELDERFLVQRHQLPTPRVEVGRILSTIDRVALNDISDGLASEVNELAEASSVSILIDEEKIPLSKSITNFKNQNALEWALFGGEDFELVGTASERSWQMIKNECEKNQINITEIGVVKNGPAQVLLRTKNGKRIPLHKKGFNHFK